jgi:hypothetical protein
VWPYRFEITRVRTRIDRLEYSAALGLTPQHLQIIHLPF